jgi:hypothetical protein
VPGRTFKPEFAGVRTGRFSKKDNELMIQVALPETVPTDPASFLRASVLAAIDEAERWAVKRKVPSELGMLRAVVAG